MVADRLGHRLDLDRRIAAQASEKNCQPSDHLGKVNTGSVVDRIPVQTAGKAVPQFPDALFGLPWLKPDP